MMSNTARYIASRLTGMPGQQDQHRRHDKRNGNLVLFHVRAKLDRVESLLNDYRCTAHEWKMEDFNSTYIRTVSSNMKAFLDYDIP